MRIRRLPEAMTHQIAAGEVIERPASVVKELVENSIDAQSTYIQIAISNEKGTTLSVTDDGEGILPEDLSLAFSHHATSKISSMEDFYSLKTLGFRGEALSSIASISKIQMETRRRERESGNLLEVHGGRYIRDEEISMSPGTRMEVRDLFYNTPARLKHLRQPATEFAHISATISHLALAFPEIAFTLIHNGKVVIRTLGTGKLLDTIYSLFPEPEATSLLPLNFQQDYVQVQGYLSPLEYSRKTPRQIFFYVNNRYIRSPLLKGSIQESLQGLLPPGRYPFALVKIHINPVHIDVNVHPQKLSIRFSRPDAVMGALQGAVRETLKGKQKIPEIPQEKSPRTWKIQETPIHLPLSFHREKEEGKGGEREREEPETVELPGFLEELLPVSQIYGTYLLFQGREVLFLVDQHAAHERILYHQFHQDLKKKNHPQSQLLLTPMTLSLSPEEESYLEEKKELLQELGFQLEPFGPRSILIRGKPSALQHLSRDHIQDLFDDLIRYGTKKKDEELLCILACHGAVKAGKNMEPKEMMTLINGLSQTDNPFQCPHGRPTILQMTRRDLERYFQRS